MSSSDPATRPEPDAGRPYDAVVVGAGFGGLRMLHELRGLGLRTLVVDEAEDVGGTWHWNRYPGCRTDSESWYYCYSFSPELEKEWQWSERFPAQAEVADYLRFVADRLDMRRDIRFGTRVDAAEFDDDANVWRLRTDAGDEITATYYVAAQGILSAPYLPDFPGIDTFDGEVLFTPRWPHDRDLDFAGKRVAIVGTGATGVQLVPVVSRTADHTTVFQRTATYVVPSRNHVLEDVQRIELDRDRDAMWKRTELHPMALPYPPSAGRLGVDLSDEERRRALDAGWERGTFRFMFEMFDDMMTDPEINKVVADFVRDKIRSIVTDPETAELLCPDDHGVGSKRPPLGQHYYEAYNRDNVDLVSVKKTPIQEITPRGIRVGDQEYEVDVIIFATGFDAVTGGFTRVDVRGRSGASLAQRWADGPETVLAMAVDDFPNFFMVLGPQGPYAILTVVIEHTAQWIGQAIAAAREAGTDRIEARPDAVSDWNQEVLDAVAPTMAVRGSESWLFGANIPGKARVVQQYFGGFHTWLEKIREESAAGFPHFTLGAKTGAASDPARRAS